MFPWMNVPRTETQVLNIVLEFLIYQMLGFLYEAGFSNI